MPGFFFIFSSVPSGSATVPGPAFEKAGETALLKKRQNSRERGNQRFRCDGFPSPLDPHPFLSPTRGHPWTPYAMLSLFDAGVLINEFSVSWIRRLWLTVFDKKRLFRCQSRSFRPSRQASGGILFLLLESKGNCAFKKTAKICFFKSRQTLRERGNQRFRCDGFPSPYLFTRNFAVSGCS